MYIITGDCHRDFSKIALFCKYHMTSPQEDTLILLGDVGLNLMLDESDRSKKEELSSYPLEFLIVHGNHEARPENVGTYQCKEWHGGKVLFESEFPNLLFAIDGETYDFGGKKGIVIGGAYSIDRDFRLQAGLPWFPDEQPSEKIKAYVEEQLEKNQWKVDYVFSHTCPKFMMPIDLFLPSINQNTVDYGTEAWLEKLYKRIRFEKWYFGHYHDNRNYAQFELLFEEIKELGGDVFLQRLGRSKYKVGEKVFFYFWDGKEKHECFRIIKASIVE